MSSPAPETNLSLYGHRLDSYEVDLVNLDGEVEQQLYWTDGTKAGVLPGGTLEMSNATDTRESARLTIVRDRGEDIDWLRYRLRISYVGAGFDEPQPLATLMPTAAPQRHPNHHVVEELELHSMLAVLLRSTMRSTFGIEEGSRVTDWITEIVSEAGIEQMHITPSSRTLAASKVWEPNTSRLRIINDLSEIIGYWSIKTDPLGAIVSEPKVPLAAREAVFTFDDAPTTGIYMPDWTIERDLLVPNRVTVIQRVEGIWDPIVASAELPTEHPQSAESRGYYDDRVEVDVDFADAAAGYLKALDLLGDGLPTEVRTFEHLWVPDVVPNAKVVHRRTGLHDLVGTVQRQSYRIATGGLVETRIVGADV